MSLSHATSLHVCWWHLLVGATHGCEFSDRFVGASRASLPAGPSVKASLPCRASLPGLPAARLLLNAVYRLLLNVSVASLFFTRASRTSHHRGQRARLDSDMCARIDRSTCLVEPSCSLSHSRNTHIWHRLLGGLSRLFIVNLGSLSALCPSCL